MRGWFPFTDYDFWAYIAAGFVFLFALDHVLQTGWMLRKDWTVVEGLLATACAYAIGHILAGLASALIERRLVRRWLGSPSETLLGDGKGPVWFRRIYPSYYEPLPDEIRDAVFASAKAVKINKPGEAMFWAAFNAARPNKAAMARMDTFLNQYGMCRNLAFTAFICAALLCGSAYWHHTSDDYWWSLAAVVLALGMLLRYLKFYRLYSVEVFTSYAYGE